MVEFRSVGRPLDENVKELEDFEDVKVLRGAERRAVVAISNGRKLERRVEGKRTAVRAPAVEIVVRSILWNVVVCAEMGRGELLRREC